MPKATPFTLYNAAVTHDLFTELSEKFASLSLPELSNLADNISRVKNLNLQLNRFLRQPYSSCRSFLDASRNLNETNLQTLIALQKQIDAPDLKFARTLMENHFGIGTRKGIYHDHRNWLHHSDFLLTDVDLLNNSNSKLGKKIVFCFLLSQLYACVTIKDQKIEIVIEIEKALLNAIKELFSYLTQPFMDVISITNSRILTLLSLELVTIKRKLETIIKLARPEIVDLEGEIKEYITYLTHVPTSFAAFYHWISRNHEVFVSFQSVAKLLSSSDGIHQFTWDFFRQSLAVYIKNRTDLHATMDYVHQIAIEENEDLEPEEKSASVTIQEKNSELSETDDGCASEAEDAFKEYKDPSLRIKDPILKGLLQLMTSTPIVIVTSGRVITYITRRHKELLTNDSSYHHNNKDELILLRENYLLGLFATKAHHTSEQKAYLAELEKTCLQVLLLTQNSSLVNFLTLSNEGTKQFIELVAHYAILTREHINLEGTMLGNEPLIACNIILNRGLGEDKDARIADFAKTGKNKELLTKELFAWPNLAQRADYIQQALNKESNTLLSAVYYTPRGKWLASLFSPSTDRTFNGSQLCLLLNEWAKTKKDLALHVLITNGLILPKRLLKDTVELYATTDDARGSIAVATDRRSLVEKIITLRTRSSIARSRDSRSETFDTPKRESEMTKLK